MGSSEPKPQKKPYEEPHLRVYGDIREITHASSSKPSNLDGGSNPGRVKTGP